jgi:hypothetical protein
MVLQLFSPTADIEKSSNNFQRRDVTTILIGLNNSKNLLHFVMKEKKNRL